MATLTRKNSYFWLQFFLIKRFSHEDSQKKEKLVKRGKNMIIKINK